MGVLDLFVKPILFVCFAVYFFMAIGLITMGAIYFDAVRFVPPPRTSPPLHARELPEQGNAEQPQLCVQLARADIDRPSHLSLLCRSVAFPQQLLCCCVSESSCCSYQLGRSLLRINPSG
eukprot:SAG22_NODE_2703_length_2298_cov_1.492042_2_plen_120_part_00